MNVGKVILGLGATVGLMTSTVAMAETHSSASLLSVRNAPVAGVRAAPALKGKSKQADDSSATGTYIVGGLAAAAVIAGVVVVASDDDNDNDNSSSPG